MAAPTSTLGPKALAGHGARKRVLRRPAALRADRTGAYEELETRGHHNDELTVRGQSEAPVVPWEQGTLRTFNAQILRELEGHPSDQFP